MNPPSRCASTNPSNVSPQPKLPDAANTLRGSFRRTSVLTCPLSGLRMVPPKENRLLFHPNQSTRTAFGCVLLMGSRFKHDLSTVAGDRRLKGLLHLLQRFQSSPALKRRCHLLQRLRWFLDAEFQSSLRGRASALRGRASALTPKRRCHVNYLSK
jgi:hypothetical protein